MFTDNIHKSIVLKRQISKKDLCTATDIITDSNKYKLEIESFTKGSFFSEPSTVVAIATNPKVIVTAC